MNYCYINGLIKLEQEASIPITNLGVQRGLGVFDLFRTRNGKPTFLPDYLNRFQNSQSFLNLNAKISNEEIEQAVKDLQEKNRFSNSTFKLVLLGEGLDTDASFHPFFYIQNTPIADDFPLVEGQVITHAYVREFPRIKTMNYTASYLLHRQKVKHQAVDVIFHQNELISEASRSNVFVIKDGVLFTPKDQVLLGITRKQVLSLAASVLPVEVTDISVTDLLNADEVFLSSTIKQVMPITKIDDRVIGRGVAGPFTLRIRNAFLELAAIS